MALLPTWVPIEPLLIALVVTLAAMYVMNRGSPWFINAKAQDEPVAVGIGVFLLLAAGWFTDTLGLSMLPAELFWLVGGGAVALGLVARYTEYIDISGLV